MDSSSLQRTSMGHENIHKQEQEQEQEKEQQEQEQEREQEQKQKQKQKKEYQQNDINAQAMNPSSFIDTWNVGIRNRLGHVSSSSSSQTIDTAAIKPDYIEQEDDNNVVGISTATRLHSKATVATFSPGTTMTTTISTSTSASSLQECDLANRSEVDMGSSAQINRSVETSSDESAPSAIATTSILSLQPSTSTSTEASSNSMITTSGATTSFTTTSSTTIADSDSNAEFSCNICFDTSVSPVLTLCGHLFCWSCLHQWLEAQRQNPTCPVCKAGCAQDKVIPIYGRGKEQVDPRSTTPKRPAGQRPEPFRSPNQIGTGFTLATGQVTFTGTMIPPFMFSPFGVHYGASYAGAMGPNGAVQTPMQAYVSRLFFMLGALILVGILLY